VGCGSGILALVALALGAARVRAIDLDPDAVAVTRENAGRNGVGARLQTDETPVGGVSESYDVVLANIESRTLVDLAQPLVERVLPGGLLVLSGILSPEVAPSQLAEIRLAFRSLREEEIRTKGEWIAVRMGRVNHTPQPPEGRPGRVKPPEGRPGRVDHTPPPPEGRPGKPNLTPP
jgi:ribosomal protein L11 methyltransferase